MVKIKTHRQEREEEVPFGGHTASTDRERDVHPSVVLLLGSNRVLCSPTVVATDSAC